MLAKDRTRRKDRTRLRRALPVLAAAATACLPAAGGVWLPAAAAPHPAAWTDCRNGYVGLTYDDGPNPESTTPLLNALRAGGARATFFIWGQHAEQYPALLESEQNAGMWLGNHTTTHPRLTTLAEPAVHQEIGSTQRTIQRITGTTPTLFRPPYGDTNARVRADAARLGLAEVLWGVDSQDWNGATTEQIVQAAATLGPGGIILMHDGGYRSTVAAVPRILAGLAARGLCPGRIVWSPNPGTGAGQTPHAVAVAP
ncbi:polysaccharide deacetylase family protein [Kitasatospora sp. NPDC057015]|uniref:polysaccharide deacetylase family protein n=1 Tax=Kitasatospora sp. NPDC057015 TaxID=3346001 RepID=UPI003644F08E